MALNVGGHRERVFYSLGVPLRSSWRGQPSLPPPRERTGRPSFTSSPAHLSGPTVKISWTMNINGRPGSPGVCLRHSPRGREENQTRLAGGRRRLSRPPSSFIFLLMFSFAFWSSRPKGPNTSTCSGSGPEFPTYYSSGIEGVPTCYQIRGIWDLSPLRSPKQNKKTVVSQASGKLLPCS